MPPRLRRSLSNVSYDETDDGNSNDRTENGADNPMFKRMEVTRQLRKLSMDRSGKFFENWNPEHSNRETRKLTRKLYAEGGRKVMHDDNGILIKANADFCDCLEEDCPGCHFPCPKCSSQKCGHECRNNRKWTYDYVEIDGSDHFFKNKYK